MLNSWQLLATSVSSGMEEKEWKKRRDAKTLQRKIAFVLSGIVVLYVGLYLAINSTICPTYLNSCVHQSFWTSLGIIIVLVSIWIIIKGVRQY